ncbi:methionyl-tRNA formyltransferase [Pedobacter sp. ok626]|uniref:formyltransferase family protein n=1 Tax=Pedobacter sp. ok626 TaxID=1761882 RepID=UPI000891E66E|nr:formyltransferase family protein [Pedobacter sp. ok626]SDJ32770.1 methionyl-tRNA formyltransferase [Pedobacter sp. ok626]
MKVIVANCNPALNEIQEQIILKYNGVLLKEKEELNMGDIIKIDPTYIFFMHWSWIIPAEIFSRYTCVVFHMTDLPYGRGGSPLQNLIIRGHKETKITAIKVEEGLDTGDIYLKKELSLKGKASEIFKRTGEVISTMIDEIIERKIVPVRQEGAPTVFVRRKPADSYIPYEIEELEKLYDFIRMLDATNYPHAFLINGNLKFEFTNAELTENNELLANVRIIKK